VDGTEQHSGRRWRLAIGGALALYAAAFLVYAETWGFAWDEGYHLLTAQLILAGRRPYLDFCFPQTPLNAYWNAAWMAIFGQSWHVAHLVSALLTIAAVVLTADYVARRFPVASWRWGAVLVTTLAIGLNSKVFFYGGLGQPYGMCLCALVLAFRMSTRAAGARGFASSIAAGCFAGVAAGASLLTAVAAPVLLAWIVVYDRAAVRWRKAAAFAIGAAIPFAPVFRLAVLGPRQAWFNLVQYHASFRKLYWPDTTQHDLEVLTSWLDSGAPLLLGLLAIVGLVYVARRSAWKPDLRAEFYLAAWLAAGLSLEVGRAHPTFPQYFLLIVPFLAILASAGLCALAPERPGVAAPLLCLLLAMGLGRAVYDRREVDHWDSYERLAKRIDQITPPNAPLLADEPIYFLTKRTPPPGLELYYTHKLTLPASDRALFHIVTEAEIRRDVEAGSFPVAYACDDGLIERYGLKESYRESEDVEACSIFRSPKTVPR
jgi:hypothetical protein